MADLKNELGQAVNGSWNASSDVGGNPVIARHMLDDGERAASRTFAQLRHDTPLPVLDQIPPVLRAEYTSDEHIYAVSARGYGTWINPLTVPQTAATGRLFGLLDQANSQYRKSADEAHTLSMVGTGAAILLLATAFLAMYRRAFRLAEVNRHDAVTDALSDLPNRRALMNDLDAALAQATPRRPLTLAMFDLDGFKSYNDAFGHAAGDALLTRLGRALSSACDRRAIAYRLGGDEFCVLVRAEDENARAAVLADARAALSGSGEAWAIGSSDGVVVFPEEAQTVSEARAR